MVEMQSARLKRAGIARCLLEARDFSHVRLHNRGCNKKEKRLDYIFCNKKRKIKSSYVFCNGKAYPIVSDHYGVYIEVE